MLYFVARFVILSPSRWNVSSCSLHPNKLSRCSRQVVSSCPVGLDRVYHLIPFVLMGFIIFYLSHPDKVCLSFSLCPDSYVMSLCPFCPNSYVMSPCPLCPDCYVMSLCPLCPGCYVISLCPLCPDSHVMSLCPPWPWQVRCVIMPPWPEELRYVVCPICPPLCHYAPLCPNKVFRLTAFTQKGSIIHG